MRRINAYVAAYEASLSVLGETRRNCASGFLMMTSSRSIRLYRIPFAFLRISQALVEQDLSSPSIVRGKRHKYLRLRYSKPGTLPLSDNRLLARQIRPLRGAFLFKFQLTPLLLKIFYQIRNYYHFLCSSVAITDGKLSLLIVLAIHTNREWNTHLVSAIVSFSDCSRLVVFTHKMLTENCIDRACFLGEFLHKWKNCYLDWCNRWSEL